MCGIAGFIARSAGRVTPGQIAAEMAAKLVHRGPDDAGLWEDPAAGIALSHRRLSIIDTSAGGHQPMASSSGRFTVTYNGEIYNYRELKSELLDLGARFSSQSDTEVLLAAIEQWGLPTTLSRLVGMFAFAVWDAQERKLWLVRDRAGEKPLYYGHFATGFGFASELKALREVPGFNPEINRQALGRFLKLGYVPAPLSIYQSVEKLLPGHYAQVRAEAGRPASVAVTSYWSLANWVETSGSPSYEEARSHAEQLLASAVRSQMVSDVPLGAFLSGGIDSTAIVALMQEASTRPVRTFSLGSTEAAYDEASSAAAVARHLKTDHTEFYVTPEIAQSVVPDLARIYDEPFGDSSQIPTVLVSRLARRNVSVALSGDAGDEIFGGYNRYVFAPSVWRWTGSLPKAIRSLCGAGIRALSVPAWDRLGDALTRTRKTARMRILGERLHKLARAMPATSHREFYDRLAGCWLDPPVSYPFAEGPADAIQVPQELSTADHFTELMMYLDYLTYLPDDILVKVDRATMSTSLESRIPILDHRLVEFVCGLPLAFKISGGRTKRILRDIVDSRVPSHLVERPKAGFGMPIDAWLRGPLRDWAEALLSPNRLRHSNLIDAAAVSRAWQEHLAGHTQRHHELWTVLMLQAWLEENRAV